MTVEILPAAHWRALVWVAAVAAVLLPFVWLVYGISSAVPWFWAGPAVPCVALVLAWRALAPGRIACGRLRWDGESWWFLPAEDDPATEARLAALCTHVDLGRWMLLRARRADAAGPGEAVLWFALQASAVRGSWTSLRRAVLAAHGGSLAAKAPPESALQPAAREMRDER